MQQVVAYVEERVAYEPEIAERFSWSPMVGSRDGNSWALHVHRRQGRWSFSIHMPAAWTRVIEAEVRRREVRPLTALVEKRGEPGVCPWALEGITLSGALAPDS